MPRVALAERAPGGVKRARRLPLRFLPWLLAAALLTIAGRAEENEPGFLAHSHWAWTSDARVAPGPRRGLLDAGAAALDRAGFEDRAEVELVSIYALVADGHLRQALARSDALAARYPHFALAQLLRGDLLLASAGRLDGFADAPVAPDRAPALAALVDEARKRLRAYTAAPPPGAVPSNLLALAPDVRHAIVVDTGASRLYLFRHAADGGTSLEASYYVTQGKLGTDKRRAGDLRTPLGIYFVTRRVGARYLGAIYGAAAMPLNYPNAWDRMLGRTGGGIWLHGVPPDSYARPPRDSDGCVVLANPDVTALMERVAVDLTPVVIVPHVRWLTAAQMATERAALRTTLGRVGGAGATVLRFAGQDDLLVVQRGNGATMSRDYWARVDGRWQLFHEGTLS